MTLARWSTNCVMLVAAGCLGNPLIPPGGLLGSDRMALPAPSTSDALGAAIPVRRLAAGDRSQIVEARQVVIGSPGEWEAIWRQTRGADDDRPAVDFGRDVVVAVYAGERPSTGYQVIVDRAEKLGDAVVVTVREVAPSASDVVADVLTYPYQFVSLPRSAGRVVFAPQRGSR